MDTTTSTIPYTTAELDKTRAELFQAKQDLIVLCQDWRSSLADQATLAQAMLNDRDAEIARLRAIIEAAGLDAFPHLQKYDTDGRPIQPA